VLRAGVCLAALAAIDPWIPGLLERAERRRYESAGVFRFENSDLFMVAPLSAYLAEHPRGERPRVAFFGDSTVWGYRLLPHQTIPAGFQRLAPEVRVLNLGINGFQAGSAYVMTQALVNGLDACYLVHTRRDEFTAHPMLGRLLPVSREDRELFRIAQPDRMQRWLRGLVTPWRLADAGSRLQGAWFGTSTRQYVYQHKGEVLRRAMGRAVPETPAPDAPREPAPGTYRWDQPVPSTRPTADEQAGVRRRHPVLWRYGELLARSRTRGVILSLTGFPDVMSAEDQRVFNGAFSPWVIAATLTVPEAWLLEGQHFTADGAAAVAWILHQRTFGHVRPRAP
jgi:hypothetical protein